MVKSHFYYSLAGWPWANYTASLSLDYKMGAAMAPTSESYRGSYVRKVSSKTYRLLLFTSLLSLGLCALPPPLLYLTDIYPFCKIQRAKDVTSPMMPL